MLTNAERLQLQQLRLREWADSRTTQPDDSAEIAPRTKSPTQSLSSFANEWNLTEGIEFYDWQQSAMTRWFAAGRRGTIKVVTGAGKTVLALGIGERLHHQDPELRIAVVVPTIVLMNQWYDTLRDHSNLPAEAIGRLGGGHRDTYDGSTRVLIAVLASARKELPGLVREAGIGEHLLFIADECHRLGAPEMSAVLDTARAYSLGLSATPERDESDESGNASHELADIGPIVYEMTFADAINAGILPPFEVHHFGLPLTAEEGRRYANLSRSITDLRRELLAASPAARKAGGGERLLTWARRASSRSSGRLGPLASRYVNDTRRRKQLLYRAESRKQATLELIRTALRARRDARVILFHESIDEVVTLFELLVGNGVPAVMEHSELPSQLREGSLELFRSGAAQVVVSARSLIEGFNVPEADLGIIVASSSSPRQRIQSIGRVLRRYRDAAGEQKTSRVCVLYIRDTVDETIYEREDWAKLIGLDRNRYFTWAPPNDPVEETSPPRAAVPTEAEVDWNALSVGDTYPGRYDGDDYSTDSHDNVLDPDGRIATNPQSISQVVTMLRGGPGRFKITPRRRALLVLRPAEDGGWDTLFGGFLGEPFEFASPVGDPDVDVAQLSPGDAYPGPLEPAEEVRFRQRQGGTIAKHVRGGEAFARGREADRLVKRAREATRVSGPITRIFINHLGHAYWREAGTARFITALDGQLEFPSLTGDE